MVKVKVALPALTPTTTPLFVTEATEGLELVHIPPLVGDTEDEELMHIGLDPVTLTVGLLLTVIGVVAREVHPVEVWVNVNVAVPPDIPVTTPPLVTVATAALLLVHVPPVFGSKDVVLPTQIVDEPATFTVGLAFTPMVVKAVPVHPKLFVTVTR